VHFPGQRRTRLSARFPHKPLLGVRYSPIDQLLTTSKHDDIFKTKFNVGAKAREFEIFE